MKKFLRNMNRGIALLIVLAIGFAGYVVYDTVSFKKEKPQIEKLMESYFGELNQMSLLPEEYRTAGKLPTQEVINQKRTENRAVIDKYFTTKEVRNGWMDKGEILRELDAMLEKMKSGNDFVTGVEIGFKDVESIKKIAPNTAVVNVNYFYTYRAVGNCDVFTGNGFSHTEWMVNNPAELSDGKLREYKATQCSTDFTLYKTSDGWKIAKLSGSGSWSSSPVIVVDNSSEGGTTDGE